LFSDFIKLKKYYLPKQIVFEMRKFLSIPSSAFDIRSPVALKND